MTEDEEKIRIEIRRDFLRDISLHLHCMLLREFSLSAEVGEELTARDVLHQEEEVAGVLGEPLQADLSTRSICWLAVIPQTRK